MFGKKLRNPNVFPFGECQKKIPPSGVTHSVGGGFFSKNCLKTHLQDERSERGNINFFASGRGGALRFPPPFDVDVSPSEVNSGHFTCVVLYMRLIFSYYSPFIFKPTVTSLNSYTVYHHECTGNVLS